MCYHTQSWNAQHVCIYHQNVKLIIHNENLKEYTEQLQKLVCDIKRDKRMLHLCSWGPQKYEQFNYLLELEH